MTLFYLRVDRVFTTTRSMSVTVEAATLKQAIALQTRQKINTPDDHLWKLTWEFKHEAIYPERFSLGGTYAT